MRYRAIQEHARRYPDRLMCRALAVLPAGCYAWRGPPESRQAAVNQSLLFLWCYGTDAKTDRTVLAAGEVDMILTLERSVGQHLSAAAWRTDQAINDTLQKQDQLRFGRGGGPSNKQIIMPDTIFLVTVSTYILKSSWKDGGHYEINRYGIVHSVGGWLFKYG